MNELMTVSTQLSPGSTVKPILPAIIADAGEQAAQTLRRVLHRHHPQRQHPRRPTPGPSAISSPGASGTA